MSFTDAVRSAFSNYANFSGRALRSEYWWFALFQALVWIAFILAVVTLGPTGYSALSALAVSLLVYYVATVIPSLSLLVRRLHDTDHSGWWMFVPIIPFGGLVLFVFLLMEGTPGPNRFGPSRGRPVGPRSRYDGPSQAEAWQRFAEDAQRAAASGYRPIHHEWQVENGYHVLIVTYEAAPEPAPWETRQSYWT